MRGKFFSEKSFFTLQLLVDYGIIAVALLASYILVSGYEGLALFSYREILLTATIFYGIVFTIYKPYNCGKKKYSETMLSTLVALAVLHMAVIITGYFFKESKIPNGIFLCSFFMSAIVFALIKRLVFSLYSRIHTKERAVIIGSDQTKERIAAKLIQHMDHLHETRYILDSQLLNFEEIRGYIDGCDIVYLSHDLDEEIKTQVMYYCYEKHKAVYLSPSVSWILQSSGRFTTLDDMPVFVQDNHVAVEELFLKRCMDIFLAFLGLVLTSPLLVLGYMGVKIQDGGPAFYSQERLTKDNRSFKLIKFRSMVMDAENGTGPVLAANRDQRITPFGRVLRKTRIDELPQLFNVIRGDMSIVGPRPERPELALGYIAEFPQYRYRTKFKAGMTGLAQVWGKYNTSFKDKLLLDLYYINNFSFVNDIKILFFTIKIVFKLFASDGVGQVQTLEEVALERNCRVIRRHDGIIEMKSLES
ncbi:MAG: hypothetical protein AVO33_04230 [delta proteobacterium ML8_F1]|nr:MAG: hypothetical protein AVO33_04230 [delta proteobacterium ML8_F1]